MNITMRRSWMTYLPSDLSQHPQYAIISGIVDMTVDEWIISVTLKSRKEVDCGHVDHDCTTAIVVPPLGMGSNGWASRISA